MDDTATSPVIRMRGLPYQATENDIMEFFRSLAIDVICICLNYQGRPTGECYVKFASTEVAAEGLKRNRRNMGHRYIELFAANESDLESAVQMNAQHGSRANDGGDAAGTGNNGTDVPAAGPDGHGKDKRYQGVLRLRGLPYSASAADITEFFSGFEIALNGIVLTASADGRPTGEAFVEFTSEQQAMNAMSRHGERIGTRYIELFRGNRSDFANAQERAYGIYSATSGNSSYAGRAAEAADPSTGGGFYNNHGAEPGLGHGGGSRSQGGSTSAGSFLKLRGLPYSATEQDVTDFFEDIGVVVQGGVHIVMRGDRPTGEAYVELVSPEAALRARETRHRQRMGSRYVEVFRVSNEEVVDNVFGGVAPAHLTHQPPPQVALHPTHAQVAQQDQQQLQQLPAQLNSAEVGYTTNMQMMGGPMMMGQGQGDPSQQAAMNQQAQWHWGQGMMQSQVHPLGMEPTALVNAAHFGLEWGPGMGGIMGWGGHTSAGAGGLGGLGSGVNSVGNPMHVGGSIVGMGGIGSTEAVGQMGLGSGGFGYHGAASSAPGVVTGDTNFGQPAVSVPHVAVPGTVRMRGLPFNVNHMEILEFFRGYHVLADSLRLGSSADGRPNGEAWVMFGTSEEADRAIQEKNRQMIGNRYIELFSA